MTDFNPGRLQKIARYTSDQPIIPGSGRYDYGMSGGVGRTLPAVGNYPSGAPAAGLAGYLADAGSPPLSPVAAAIAIVGVSAALYWLAAFSKRHSR